MAAWRSGSLSRSLLATARSSSVRSSPPLPRLRRTSFAAPPPPRRRLPFLHPRSVLPSKFHLKEKSFLSRVFGGAGMHAVAPSASQRRCFGPPHVAPLSGVPRLLRALTGYLLPHLSGSLVGMEKMGNAKVAVGMQGRLVSRLPAVYLSSNRVDAAVMLLRVGTTTIGIVTL
ncbi:hypothetical protein CKAN_02630700 [Cinnamomum micranthum f. kanehirae]|uniref:Uncharacterized protein n=1 Tax=Cinnamomum micranthum f. kanehirae TaxID=337451 RepID=A0A3S3NQY6_9MAGN|nr:hypothetical protein CKAN_02630700 [Cinnamomum micranthum f. kanehirae]